VLAQIDCCLLGVPFKGLPAQLKPSVHELYAYIHCMYASSGLIIRAPDEQGCDRAYRSFCLSRFVLLLIFQRDDMSLL
jgi:hypothetical protein